MQLWRHAVAARRWRRLPWPCPPPLHCQRTVHRHHHAAGATTATRASRCGAAANDAALWPSCQAGCHPPLPWLPPLQPPPPLHCHRHCHAATVLAVLPLLLPHCQPTARRSCAATKATPRCCRAAVAALALSMPPRCPLSSRCFHAASAAMLTPPPCCQSQHHTANAVAAVLAAAALLPC